MSEPTPKPQHADPTRLYALIAFCALISAITVISVVPTLGAFITGLTLAEGIAAIADKTANGLTGIAGVIGGLLARQSMGGNEQQLVATNATLADKVPPVTGQAVDGSGDPNSPVPAADTEIPEATPQNAIDITPTALARTLPEDTPWSK